MAIKLGVNIDHVATLRQARGEGMPDLISAAKEALKGGANSIVAHLREDRRHIQDKDIFDIRKLPTRFDMEMAATNEMLNIAMKVRPDIVTLVPEKRAELTTEGGLDVKGNLAKLVKYVSKLETSGIKVSLFIDPDHDQIKAASRTGASFIEIHTGKFANSNSKADLKDIINAAKYARSLGLRVNAGHGLNYNNVRSVVAIDGIEELNIGFSIIAKSVFTGIRNAVAEMKKLLVFIAALVLLSNVSYATLEAGATFRDVPAGHWAADPVNDLVKMGVTQGYPDGTFRGTKTITRYETAVFLSKLAHSNENKDAVNEKIFEELRAEVYKIRYTLDLYKKPPEKKKPVEGSLTGRLRFGNIVSANAASEAVKAPFGPVFDYRLITSYKQEFGENGSPAYGFVRLGLDTMDSGMSISRDFVRELLEAEAEINMRNGFGISVTSGPGLVIHREGPINVFPSEDYMVYLRPGNGIKFSYENNDLDTGLGYKATSIEATGLPKVNDIYAYLGYKFRGTWLWNIYCRYYFHSFTDNLKAGYSSAESMVNIYEFNVFSSKQLQYNLRFGVTASQNTPHNLFASFSLISSDLFKDGSSLKLFANKIGSEFFDFPTYPALMGVNIFDKLYAAGTYDIGFEISQIVSRGMAFRVVSDIVTGTGGIYGVEDPKSNAAIELDLDLGIYEGAVLTLGYKVYQAPSAATNATSDILGIGLRYIY
jgi:pyridoxine 5-phosphate synthase